MHVTPDAILASHMYIFTSQTYPHHFLLSQALRCIGLLVEGCGPTQEALARASVRTRGTRQQQVVGALQVCVGGGGGAARLGVETGR